MGKRESAILEAIQSLATQNPGACAELVTKMFDKLAEADRNAYRYLMNRVISQELGAAGLKVALEQAKQALSVGLADRVEERINAIEGWLCTLDWIFGTVVFPHWAYNFCLVECSMGRRQFFLAGVGREECESGFAGKGVGPCAGAQ